MSKQVKRKITVNLTQKSKGLTKNRPSVFERLGTKAGSTHNKEYCHHWAQNGTCPYGKNCKYSVTHTLISPSKQRAAKKESESKTRHGKDVHKRLHGGVDDESYDWDPEELEDADPDDLEKRRLEIQRELELVKMENKARKKEKKLKKESSPSTESSTSSSDSSSSSDESSSSSSSSVETRRKKLKKTKKRDSSSSSECDRSRKHKSRSIKRTSKLIARTEKCKKIPPKIAAKAIKSPSPIRGRKLSQTPPLKAKTLVPVKKTKSQSKSPRPISRLSDRKEKHLTPSPKISKDKEKDKEREKEKEREREKEKERERERERGREREREREKEREREREREREKEREKARERAREREKEQKKKDSRSPKRDAKIVRDIKKKDSPDSSHSRDRKSSPSRSRGSGSSSSRKEAHKSPPPKDGRSDKKDDHDKRSKERVLERKRPDKRDSRDRDRERDRERERRIAREEREAAREKEREEALARCQERQRERERLKEQAKKEEERRNRDRNRREDRGLDKPAGDRVERLLPLPADRIPPARKESLERERTDRQCRDRDRRDRTPDSRRTARKSVERHDRLDRIEKDRMDRSYDRSYERDRDHDREQNIDRDYASVSRIRDDIRSIDKHYDSPYERTRHDERRYMEMEHYNENSRDDRLPIEYPDDRRSRRDLWEDMDIDRDREIDHRRYREESRPQPLKARGEWSEDYGEHDWGDRSRRPLDWETRDSWDTRDHEQVQLEEEWRHYNRSMDSWPADDRRRWPADWRERSRPRSSTSHREDDSHLDARRKEPIRPEQVEPKIIEPEPKKDATLGKRPAEQPAESDIEAKKPCIKETAPLEDDFSEISDDADEILNRDEEIAEAAAEEAPQEETVKPEENDLSQTSQPQRPDSPKQSSIKKEESIDEDNGMELDFEEISEDELEEETRVKGLGDALGVDWASLVAESRPRTKPVSSAKRRWESHNVLINLGISVHMAGEELVKEILKEHAEAKFKEDMKNIKEESENSQNILKSETMTNGIEEIHIKKENDDDVFINEVKEVIIKKEFEERETLPDIQISHPVAAIQVAVRENQAIRKSLFSSAGPFRRALSARRDLAIRRHLCNLPIRDTFVEAPKRHNPELFKLATQLFQRCL